MPLEPGQKLANYEILSPLGAGGMGEVWRARDTRLGRDVAIKALPDAFARDPDRLARFEREAKLLASLNHPNIGSIYGLEVVDGHRYLVLEFLEGETLSGLVSRGPVPVGEAIEICAQVAGALESAHESGIVHRDLKPGNVMLLRNGTVKVLDFGLAKGDGGHGSDAGASASPTMTYGATQAGMVLGTAAYMSPEQARGKVVDKRTDIWSFGCVLFECLAGRQAFAGETVSDLIAHILTSEPDWNALPPATPARVRELLRRCLEKDARRRLRDMGDARIELEETLAPRGSSSMAVPASIAAGIDAAQAKPHKRNVPLELAAVIVGAVAAVLATRLIGPLVGPKPLPRPSVRFQVVENDSMKFIQEGSCLALSPDGSLLAFVTQDSVGMTHLWVRPLSAIGSRMLAGTEGAQLPFFSPDGQSIGFFTETKLKRVSLADGDVEAITDVKRARGGAWNAKDQILFAPTSDGPLFMVAASGGEARPVTTLDSTRGESGHRFPEFLPDGNHFLYASLPPHGNRYTILVGTLRGDKPDSVTAIPGGARFVKPGWILYQDVTRLFAQRFDPGSRRVKGSAMPLRESAFFSNFSGNSAVYANNGVLAFLQLQPLSSRLAWVDADGKEAGPLPFAPGKYTGQINFSPDGRYLVFGRSEDLETIDLWIGDLATGGETRFATEPRVNDAGIWSPDGTRIAYQNSEAGPQTIVVKTAFGNEPGRRYLVPDVSFKQVDGWTPDSKRIVFDRQNPSTRWDLWILDVATGTAKPLLAGPFNEQSGYVSADGRWLTYTSDETGRQEIYVRPFDAPGPPFQVTTTGGLRSTWSRNGNQLRYQTASEPLVLRGADVVPGPEFRLGPARPIFRIPPAIQGGDVTSDGRFAILLPAGKPQPAAITVVTDWTSLLHRR